MATGSPRNWTRIGYKLTHHPTLLCPGGLDNAALSGPPCVRSPVLDLQTGNLLEIAEIGRDERGIVPGAMAAMRALVGPIWPISGARNA